MKRGKRKGGGGGEGNASIGAGKCHHCYIDRITDRRCFRGKIARCIDSWIAMTKQIISMFCLQPMATTLPVFHPRPANFPRSTAIGPTRRIFRDESPVFLRFVVKFYFTSSVMATIFFLFCKQRFKFRRRIFRYGIAVAYRKYYIVTKNTYEFEEKKSLHRYKFSIDSDSYLKQKERRDNA